MKKLLIQIPAYNEEEALTSTIESLPREVKGFDVVEFLVVDDGSTDCTIDTARKAGADYIVRHTTNQGLARAFATGIDACLRLGADVIVNTDADNQYSALDIPALVAPILAAEADMVIGDRQTDDIQHFSSLKKRLQKTGSWVVRQASGTNIRDAPSGFRAISRRAALELNIVSDFTYTLESIIQAGQKGIAVSQVPVRTNQKVRDSRLFTSAWQYITRSAVTIVRVYSMYRPLRVFLSIGAVLWFCGLMLGVRFLYYYFTGHSSGHVQSLLLGVLLMIMGFQTGITGLLADLIRHNRKLIEESLWRIRKAELGEYSKPDGANVNSAEFDLHGIETSEDA